MNNLKLNFLFPKRNPISLKRNYRIAVMMSLFLGSFSWAEAEVTKVTKATKVAEVNNTDNTRISLEHELQNIKKDILKINRDLFILEEDLLFPSNTQTKVFLSTDVGQYFKLDSVTLKINDKLVANHLYTERELIALERGAIQRLHTENLSSGSHEIVAIVVGSGPENRDYRRAVSSKFNKGTGPKYLQLIITGDRVKQQPEFAFKAWE